MVLGLAMMLATTPLQLDLACSGGGSRTVIRGPSGSHSFNFGDQVSIELRGDNGRIRVPAAMLPDIHSGSRDGWRDLSDIRVNDREISARFRFNMLNRPRIRIDRATGHLSIDAGRGQFSAECSPVDPAARRF